MPARKPVAPCPTEHQEQALFFQRLGLSRWKNLPIFAVPNFAGHHGSAVSRIVSGKRANAEGRRKGVPDIVVAVVCHGYPGLYIEMKRLRGGSVDPEQKGWHRKLAAQGYAVAVCKGHEAAWTALTQYLEGRWDD
jgi:hypothetical protein